MMYSKCCSLHIVKSYSAPQCGSRARYIAIGYIARGIG